MSWPSGASAQLFRRNCQPVGFYQGRLVYNSRNANGVWDVYIDGNSITSPCSDLVREHRGGIDVKGSLLLLEAGTGSDASQEPGKGYQNDVYLLDLSAGRAVRLTHGRKGTIWAKLNATGDRVCWSEMVQPPLESGDLWNYALGTWQVHVANIQNGALFDEYVFGGTGFYETYGWLDDQTLMFASDVGVQPTSWWLGHWFASQLWIMPDLADSTPTRVSPPVGGQNLYHEFMHVAPAGLFADGADPWIVCSICEDTAGMDLWRLQPYGSGKQRVTYFNNAGYAVVGDLAFDPVNPKIIWAGVSPNINATTIDAYQITLP